MNLHEHELSYPFADTLPAPATRLEVAPGVYWLRMPLPFALDHINLWLLRDGFRGRDGWTVIDCGVATDTIRGHWETLFADGLDGLPIVRVLCTHTHPDHVGLAGWLTDRFDAPLWMTLGEYAMGRILSVEMPGSDPLARVRHYRRHGLGEVRCSMRSGPVPAATFRRWYRRCRSRSGASGTASRSGSATGPGG
jgi:hypothetical protein